MADGVLTGSYSGPQRSFSLAPTKLDRPNLIPMPLQDLFSSLVDPEDSGDGVVFALVDFKPSRAKSDPIQEIWVRPGGDIPQEIERQTTWGSKVNNRWLGNDLRQDTFYDRQHQIVWQNSRAGTSSMIMTVVSRGELVEVFPDSDAVLQRWIVREEHDEGL